MKDISKKRNTYAKISSALVVENGLENVKKSKPRNIWRPALSLCGSGLGGCQVRQYSTLERHDDHVEHLENKMDSLTDDMQASVAIYNELNMIYYLMKFARKYANNYADKDLHILPDITKMRCYALTKDGRTIDANSVHHIIATLQKGYAQHCHLVDALPPMQEIACKLCIALTMLAFIDYCQRPINQQIIDSFIDDLHFVYGLSSLIASPTDEDIILENAERQKLVDIMQRLDAPKSDADSLFAVINALYSECKKPGRIEIYRVRKAYEAKLRKYENLCKKHKKLKERVCLCKQQEMFTPQEQLIYDVT